MRKRCKAKCLFPLYCSEYSDTWCGRFCELCNNPWIEKLKSSCQIMEGFELKVIWTWMEFYSSAKFCSKALGMFCGNRCIAYLVFFLPFFLCTFYLQLSIFHLLPVLLSTAGVTFHPFLQYSPHTNHGNRLSAVSIYRAHSTDFLLRMKFHAFLPQSSCMKHVQWIYTNFRMKN